LIVTPAFLLSWKKKFTLIFDDLISSLLFFVVRGFLNSTTLLEFQPFSSESGVDNTFGVVPLLPYFGNVCFPLPPTGLSFITSSSPLM